MNILIVSATKFEIKQLLNDLIYIKQVNSYLSSYKYNNLHIDVLITGIGMIFTIYRLTKVLSEKKMILRMRKNQVNKKPFGKISILPRTTSGSSSSSR
ncbi:unnamed protein product [marine sediment metagenome]|uniref:Uncharacterized protein n=1 Tax=marine sediment metagenome TaxID=412755 RepID=X1NGX6_9ZZZZ